MSVAFDLIAQASVQLPQTQIWLFLFGVGLPLFCSVQKKRCINYCEEGRISYPKRCFVLQKYWFLGDRRLSHLMYFDTPKNHADIKCIFAVENVFQMVEENEAKCLVLMGNKDVIDLPSQVDLEKHKKAIQGES